MRQKGRISPKCRRRPTRCKTYLRKWGLGNLSGQLPRRRHRPCKPHFRTRPRGSLQPSSLDGIKDSVTLGAEVALAFSTEDTGPDAMVDSTGLVVELVVATPPIGGIMQHQARPTLHTGANTTDPTPRPRAAAPTDKYWHLLSWPARAVGRPSHGQHARPEEVVPVGKRCMRLPGAQT